MRKYEKNIMEKLIISSTRMIEKLEYVLSRTWGWVSVIALTMLNYFQSVMFIYYAIIALIGIDACLGVLVSIKKGSFALSYLGRESGWKILLYTLIFMAIHVFETTFGSSVNVGLYVTFAVAGVFEILSIVANGAILKPDFPLFKFLSKYIKGEIAQKLGIDPKDVEDILSKSLIDLRSDREKEAIKDKDNEQI